MKVKELLAQLNQLDPEENVCALIITKEEFDYSEEDEVMLTNEAWDEIVSGYETNWTESMSLYEAIGIAVAESAVLRD